MGKFNSRLTVRFTAKQMEKIIKFANSKHVNQAAAVRLITDIYFREIGTSVEEAALKSAIDEGIRIGLARFQSKLHEA